MVLHTIEREQEREQERYFFNLYQYLISFIIGSNAFVVYVEYVFNYVCCVDSYENEIVK